MKKRVLVAPLNWGIGHATRCIPLINGLLNQGLEPIIASDGDALLLLKKEFSNLPFIELPGYNIRYSRKKSSFKWLLFLQLPKIKKAINAEHKVVRKIIDKYAIDGIISDNRLGVYSNQVPSVFITHQLNVLSGNTTRFSTILHTKYLKKFNECWVPDFENEPNLSGKLSHNIKDKALKIRYIGALSRLNKIEVKQKFDIMFLLSGPEPQRTLLENKLIKVFVNFKGKIAFVRGIIENEQTIVQETPFTIYNFMKTKELQDTINASNLIISRSGYTTIMDLAKLGKLAFFIPTPGQFEQEYLAKYLDKKGIVGSCNQEEFTIDQLKRVVDYSGFEGYENDIDFKTLFSLF